MPLSDIDMTEAPPMIAENGAHLARQLRRILLRNPGDHFGVITLSIHRCELVEIIEALKSADCIRQAGSTPK